MSGWWLLFVIAFTGLNFWIVERSEIAYKRGFRAGVASRRVKTMTRIAPQPGGVKMRGLVRDQVKHSHPCVACGSSLDHEGYIGPDPDLSRRSVDFPETEIRGDVEYWYGTDVPVAPYAGASVVIDHECSSSLITPDRCVVCGKSI